MNNQIPKLNILNDDLSSYAGREPVFVTFGEVMIRDTPADLQRPECTRQVHISLAGSEFTLATLLARVGIPSAYITRVPNNPYGWLVANTARSHGVNTDHIVWAPKVEPIGRYIYEIGRTPRKDIGWYQRMHSAGSKLGSEMVDWPLALKNCRLLHTSGISFGLANHSGYERNYILEAFRESIACKPDGCLIGCDFNYRSSLWSKVQCTEVMTPILKDHVDIIITTIEDMAKLYGIGCGQYSPEEIDKGDFGILEDDDLKDFTSEVAKSFNAKIVAITIRYPDTFEQHRWESAAMDNRGNFFRSQMVKPIVLYDRLGGGDTWNGGFYYGLLTAGFGMEGLQKGVLVGDAATCIKQTIMFDLPIITKSEVQDLLNADIQGGGKRTVR